MVWPFGVWPLNAERDHEKQKTVSVWTEQAKQEL